MAGAESPTLSLLEVKVPTVPHWDNSTRLNLYYITKGFVTRFATGVGVLCRYPSSSGFHAQILLLPQCSKPSRAAVHAGGAIGSTTGGRGLVVLATAPRTATAFSSWQNLEA